MNSRLLAAKIIDDVTDGRSLNDAFEAIANTQVESRDRSFIQAVCYGVCRYYTRLDAILSHLLKKPMHAKDSDVHALLLVGLFQLTHMRVPEHAAVAETVNAAVKLKKPWAKGLVNAILREYVRQADTLQQTLANDEEAQFAHPAWWIKKIKHDWPQDWSNVLSSNNEHPPFSLRVNQSRVSREDYMQRIPSLSPTSISGTECGIVLPEAVAVERLPGFESGEVSVQDGAAQLAAGLLQLGPGMRVLDACAAPGGKLCHLLEMQPRLEVCMAIEKEPSRINSIKDNLSRLCLSADVICADALLVNEWWDGKPFDRILLDAPCSASGVIRRHPDIKLLRQPEDIKTLSATQSALLKALVSLLKPGGLLVYATCSIFPEENHQVIARFLSDNPTIHEEPIQASWGRAMPCGRQILPGEHGMDGFYYACLRS